MPSMLHESLVGMFRESPDLAAKLLAELLDATVPAYDEARLVPADLSTLTPAEFRTDAVITFTNAGDGDETVVLAVIVEVQLGEEDRKKKSWPVYVVNLHARYDCPVVLLVLCTSRSIATWASQPIDVGPGSVITPLVIGPELVPVINDAERAQREPELAVLSALTHGRAVRHRDVLDAVLAAFISIDVEHAFLYSETMLVALPAGARRYLEDLMSLNIDIHKPRTKFFREWHARATAEGHAEGHAQGHAQGHVQGEAEALLTVLSARGIDVPDEAHARIMQCADLEQLKAWIRRATTAESVGELFE